MSTTIKRITLALTKEDLRCLKIMQDVYGETQSNVIKRAISFLSQMDPIVKHNLDSIVV